MRFLLCNVSTLFSSSQQQQVFLDGSSSDVTLEVNLKSSAGDNVSTALYILHACKKIILATITKLSVHLPPISVKLSLSL